MRNSQNDPMEVLAGAQVMSSAGIDPARIPMLQVGAGCLEALALDQLIEARFVRPARQIAYGDQRIVGATSANGNLPTDLDRFDPPIRSIKTKVHPTAEELELHAALFQALVERGEYRVAHPGPHFVNE